MTNEDCLQGDRFEPKPLTNADRIRAMTDEELAKFIWFVQTEAYNFGLAKSELPVDYPSICSGWLDWMRQEVKDG